MEKASNISNTIGGGGGELDFLALSTVLFFFVKMRGYPRLSIKLKDVGITAAVVK